MHEVELTKEIRIEVLSELVKKTLVGLAKDCNKNESDIVDLAKSMFPDEGINIMDDIAKKGGQVLYERLYEYPKFSSVTLPPIDGDDFPDIPDIGAKIYE